VSRLGLGRGYWSLGFESRENPIGGILRESGKLELRELIVDEATGAKAGEGVERCEDDDKPDERPAEDRLAGKEGNRAREEDHRAEALGEAVRLGIVKDYFRLHPLKRLEYPSINRVETGLAEDRSQGHHEPYAEGDGRYVKDEGEQIQRDDDDLIRCKRTSREEETAKMKMFLLLVVAICWSSCHAAGTCKVSVQAFGLFEAGGKIGPCGDSFIDVNGKRVFLTSSCTPPWKRGITTLILDEDTCEIFDLRTWDTHVSDQDTSDLAAYFDYLEYGKVLVGVSADEATNKLAAAKQELRIAGMNVDDVKYRGAFVFVTQIGDPEKTAFAKNVNPGIAKLSATIINDEDDWVTITKTA